ncbi:ubiquitin-conjugating enzyme19 [Prunus dulcis]|uniref:Ubiquitin-conjugating enzyme19 n=1 Tax=Prunus dulcis TaxID=3755 RepID=A0A4Y1R161_PRUDU|nr:ubiquitin-conjugating enzyme19 [Prunus dulcis]
MEVRPNPTADNSSVAQPQRQRQTPATTQKKPPASPIPVDTTSVSQEGVDVSDVMRQVTLGFTDMSGGDLGVSAFPEGESIFTWLGTIEGGKGTMYEGLSYKLSLRFPLDYPFKPPQVKFETMCFHPNVFIVVLKKLISSFVLARSKRIKLMLFLLYMAQDKWSSAYDCRTILLSIQSLLGEPNPESPLNSYAAALWNNKEDYRKMVHKQYFAGESLES